MEPSSSGAIIQTTPAPNDVQQIVKQLSYAEMLLKQKLNLAILCLPAVQTKTRAVDVTDTRLKHREIPKEQRE